MTTLEALRVAVDALEAGAAAGERMAWGHQRGFPENVTHWKCHACQGMSKTGGPCDNRACPSTFAREALTALRGSGSLAGDEATVEEATTAVYAFDYGDDTPLVQRSIWLQGECRERALAVLRLLDEQWGRAVGAEAEGDSLPCPPPPNAGEAPERKP